MSAPKNAPAAAKAAGGSKSLQASSPSPPTPPPPPAASTGNTTQPPPAAAPSSASAKNKKKKAKQRAKAAAAKQAAAGGGGAGTGASTPTSGGSTPVTVSEPTFAAVNLPGPPASHAPTQKDLNGLAEELKREAAPQAAAQLTAQESAKPPPVPITAPLLPAGEEQPDFGQRGSAGAGFLPEEGIPAPLPPNASAMFVDDAEDAAFDISVNPEDNTFEAPPRPQAQTHPATSVLPSAEPIVDSDFVEGAFGEPQTLEAALGADEAAPITAKAATTVAPAVIEALAPAPAAPAPAPVVPAASATPAVHTTHAHAAHVDRFAADDDFKPKPDIPADWVSSTPAPIPDQESGPVHASALFSDEAESAAFDIPDVEEDTSLIPPPPKARASQAPPTPKDVGGVGAGSAPAGWVSSDPAPIPDQEGGPVHASALFSDEAESAAFDISDVEEDTSLIQGQATAATPAAKSRATPAPATIPADWARSNPAPIPDQEGGPVHASALFSDDAETAAFGVPDVEEDTSLIPPPPPASKVARQAAPQDVGGVGAGSAPAGWVSSDPAPIPDQEGGPVHASALFSDEAETAAFGVPDVEEDTSLLKTQPVATQPAATQPAPTRTAASQRAAGIPADWVRSDPAPIPDQEGGPVHASALFSDDAETAAFGVPDVEEDTSLLNQKSTPQAAANIPADWVRSDPAPIPDQEGGPIHASALFTDDAESAAFGIPDVEEDTSLLQGQTRVAVPTAVDPSPPQAQETGVAVGTAPAGWVRSDPAPIPDQESGPIHASALFTDDAESAAFDIPDVEEDTSLLKAARPAVRGIPADWIRSDPAPLPDQQPAPTAASALFTDDAEEAAFDMPDAIEATNDANALFTSDADQGVFDINTQREKPAYAPHGDGTSAAALFSDDVESIAFDIPTNMDVADGAVDLSSTVAKVEGVTAPQPPQPMSSSAAALFIDDSEEVAFDIGQPEALQQDAGAPSTGPGKAGRNEPEAAANTSIHSMFAGDDDWLVDTSNDDTLDFGRQADKRSNLATMDDEEPFEIPDGWYDDDGNWHWYTEEEREAVRQSMVGDSAWNAAPDTSATLAPAQSENAARRTPEPESQSAVATAAALAAAAAGIGAAAVASNAYAPAPAANPYAPAPAANPYAPAPADPYAPVKKPAPAPQPNPYTPAQQPGALYTPGFQQPGTFSPAAGVNAYAPIQAPSPYAPQQSAYTPTGYAPPVNTAAAYDPYAPQPGITSPVSPKKAPEPRPQPKRVSSNAYDPPPLKPQKSFIRAAPIVTPVEPVAPPPLPNAPFNNAAPPPAPPAGPPKGRPSSQRAPSSNDRPLSPPARIPSTGANNAYDPPIVVRNTPPPAAVAQPTGYAPTGYSPVSHTAALPLSPPTGPPKRLPPSTQTQPPPKTSFDPPMRPPSRPNSRHASKPVFAPPPPAGAPHAGVPPVPPVPPIPAEFQPPPSSRPPQGAPPAFQPPPQQGSPSFQPPPLPSQHEAAPPPPPPAGASLPPPPRGPSRGASKSPAFAPPPVSRSPPPRVASPQRNASVSPPPSAWPPQRGPSPGLGAPLRRVSSSHTAPPLVPSPLRNESTLPSLSGALHGAHVLPERQAPSQDDFDPEGGAGGSWDDEEGGQPISAPPRRESVAKAVSPPSGYEPHVPEPAQSGYEPAPYVPPPQPAQQPTQYPSQPPPLPPQRPPSRPQYEPARQASPKPASLPPKRTPSVQAYTPLDAPPSDNRRPSFEPVPIQAPKEHVQATLPVDDPYAEDPYAPVSAPPAQPAPADDYNPYGPSASSAQTNDYNPYAPAPAARSNDYNPYDGKPAHASQPPQSQRGHASKPSWTSQTSQNGADPYAPPQQRNVSGDPYAPTHQRNVSGDPYAPTHQRNVSAGFTPVSARTEEYSPYSPYPGTQSNTYEPSPYAPPSNNNATEGLYSPALDPYGPRTVSPQATFGPSTQQPNYFQPTGPADPTYVPQQVLEQLPVSEDPLGRCTPAARNVPIATFGFGGVLVTAFPGGAEADSPADGAVYGYGSHRGRVTIRPVEEVAEKTALGSNETVFPGPLVFDTSAPRGAAGEKKKREAVLTYLTTRADEIERGLPYLKLSASAARREEEAKLVIVRVLTAFIQGNGRVFGAPEAEAAWRSAFQPPASSQPSAPQANGLGAQSGPTTARASPAQLAHLSSLLLTGEKREAAQYAATSGLWSHALVISSSVDAALWREMVSRFAAADLGATQTAGLKAAYAVFSGVGNSTVDDLFAASNVTDDPSADQWRDVIGAVVFNGKATDLICLDELGSRFARAGLFNIAQICFLLSPNSPFSDMSPGAGERQIMFVENARDEDGEIFAEIAEYARSLVPTPKGVDVPHPALPQLLPYKLHRAWRAAELGDTELARKYCDSVEAASKPTKNSPSGLKRHLAASMEDLIERLTGTPSVNPSSSLGVRKSKSSATLGSWIEGRLTKFIAGEDEVPEAAKPVAASPAKKDVPVGPFSHFSSISPAASGAISRTPSALDMSQPSTANSMLDPTMAFTPGTSGTGGGYSPWGGNDDVVDEPATVASVDLGDDGGEFINPMGNLVFSGGPTPTASDYTPKPAANDFEEDDDDDLGMGNSSLSRNKTPVVTDKNGNGGDSYEPKPADKGKGKAAPAAASTPATSEKALDGKPEKAGWFGGWFGGKKKEGESGGTGYTKANLGDSSSMVYDPDLKRWVVKGAKSAAATPKAAPPPPSRAQTASPSHNPREAITGRAASATPPPVPPIPANLPASRRASGAPSSLGGAPPSGPPTRPPSSAPPPGGPSKAATPSLDDLLTRPPPGRPSSGAGAKKKRATNKYVDVFQGGGE
ncbi:COPII coat assembly protein sec16 [Vanrija pseudolonga]|uniref:Protein transport protein sec16 n=1 Tax=Vanrija pseudolonga TaxID=143232 RepID=A0AAF0Y2V0_9TREE|nr:COPII coat assembly protein sec16 [Vanrija pseudolonga]